MPKIIKHKNDDKGLILISHREKPFFDYLRKQNTRASFELFENYDFVVHVGWHHLKMSDSDYIDAIFSAPGNIQDISNISDKVLPISSREFPPKDFYYENEEKDIDVTVISNAAKHRNPEKIIGLAQGLIDSGKSFKAVFVITYSDSSKPYLMDNNLERRFWDKFADSGFKENFSFISPCAYKRANPLPRWFIADLLKRSKYYFHTCSKEGESRALGEALVAGCNVYYPKELAGGAGEWANNDENCIPYSSEREVGVEIMLSELKVISNKFEKYSVDIHKKLNDYLLSRGVSQSAVYDLHKNYDLSMLLPGHTKREYSDSDWNDGVSDIVSFENSEDFFKCAGIGTKLSIINKIQLITFIKTGRWFGHLKSMVKRVLDAYQR